MGKVVVRYSFLTLEEGALEADVLERPSCQWSNMFGLHGNRPPAHEEGLLLCSPLSTADCTDTQFGEKSCLCCKNWWERGWWRERNRLLGPRSLWAMLCGSLLCRPSVSWAGHLLAAFGARLLLAQTREGGRAVRMCLDSAGELLFLGAWCRRRKPQPHVAGWGCKAQASVSIAAKINTKHLVESKALSLVSLLCSPLGKRL